MSLTLIVGYLALVCTVAANLVGLKLCKKFYDVKSTGSLSSFPFVSGAVCTLLWLIYSILTGDRVLQTVNVIACSLQLFYVACFYIFAINKMFLQFQLVAACSIMISIFTYTFYKSDNPDFVLNFLGTLASVGSIVACASPMVSVKDVLVSKTTEALPFPIIFSTFIVTTLWFFYGILISDLIVQIPNGISSILSCIQLSFFVIYPKKLKEV